jgi:hypothetical protein
VPDPRALLEELKAVLAALPRLRFGDRCFRCEASCCLRVQAGTYAVLLLPGEMYRLVTRYPQLCGARRFRRFAGIEALVGCGCSPTTSVCPIDGCGFDCRVFPLYVTTGAGGAPAVQVDQRCPLAADVPRDTVGLSIRDLPRPTTSPDPTTPSALAGSRGRTCSSGCGGRTFWSANGVAGRCG